MILQALTRYYQELERREEIAGPGWGPVKVSYALEISVNGTLEQVIPVQTEQQRGKKTVLAPREMILPAPVKRTVGVAANFLCDNSAYLLGIDRKGKPQRTAQCFAACQSLHRELLTNVNIPAARGKMAVRELIVFKHDSELGCAPAWKLFETVKVARKTDPNSPARSWQDYAVTVDEAALPAGITCTRMG